MRKNTIQLNYQVIQVVSNSWKHIVSRHHFVALSRNVLIIEDIRSNYFVLWKSGPYHNRGRVVRSYVYLLWSLWIVYQTVLLAHFSRQWKPALIKKSIPPRKLQSRFSSLRQYWEKYMLLILSLLLPFWCMCSSYAKRFNALLRNIDIFVWWRPIAEAPYSIYKVGFLENVFLILLFCSL